MDKKELLEKISALKSKQKKINAMLDDNVSMLSELLKKQMKADEQHTLYGSDYVAFFRLRKDVEVEDWPKVNEYVKAKNAFDILKKGISPKAAELRLQAGETIPGIKIKQSECFIIQAIKGEPNVEE